MKRVIILLISVSACLTVFGHGDVHERIQIVTDEISADTENPILYVKRANLYLEDGDYENTMTDLKTAQQIAGEEFPPALMTYAEMYHKLGTNDVALKYIDWFLDIKQIHVLGFRTKASILESLGDISGAIDYQKKVVIHTNTPLPENYLSIVTNLEKQGRTDEALFYCQEAMRTFGPLLSFETKIIEIHEKEGQYDEAIKIVDRIIARYERKEKWHLRKAQILLKAGQLRPAAEELVLAEVCIMKLPERIKSVPATQDLIESIEIEKNSLIKHMKDLNLDTSANK